MAGSANDSTRGRCAQQERGHGFNQRLQRIITLGNHVDLLDRLRQRQTVAVKQFVHLLDGLNLLRS